MFLTDLTEYYFIQILTVGCYVVHEIDIFGILHWVVKSKYLNMFSILDSFFYYVCDWQSIVRVLIQWKTDILFYEITYRKVTDA